MVEFREDEKKFMSLRVWRDWVDRNKEVKEILKKYKEKQSKIKKKKVYQEINMFTSKRGLVSHLYRERINEKSKQKTVLIFSKWLTASKILKKREELE